MQEARTVSLRMHVNVMWFEWARRRTLDWNLSGPKIIENLPDIVVCHELVYADCTSVVNESLRPRVATREISADVDCLSGHRNKAHVPGIQVRISAKDTRHLCEQ